MICMREQCEDFLCCEDCLNDYHPHLDFLIDIPRYYREVGVLTRECMQMLPARPSITLSEFKAQFAREQDAVLEGLKHMLALERKGIFDELDRIERHISTKYSPHEYICSNILNSIKYFDGLIQQDIIELKIATASKQGLADLRNRHLDLCRVG